MENNPIQHYKEQSVNTMTPNELLLLLYDELVKDLLRCGLALEKQEYELMEAAADKSMDIIRYLDDTLDDQYPISRDLSRMYEYFTYQLGRIKIGRNKKELEQLRPLLADMRDAFHVAERNSGVPQERDGQQI